MEITGIRGPGLEFGVGPACWRVLNPSEMAWATPSDVPCSFRIASPSRYSRSAAARPQRNAVLLLGAGKTHTPVKLRGGKVALDFEWLDDFPKRVSVSKPRASMTIKSF